MKKILYISSILLLTACSNNIFGGESRYAEDIAPVSVAKVQKQEIVLSEVAIPEGKVEEKEVAVLAEAPLPEKKKVVEKRKEAPLAKTEELDTFPSEEEVVEESAAPVRTNTGRPIIKAVEAKEFPKIKDVPESPEGFPSEDEVVKEKEALLSKTIVVNKTKTESIIFTGFDDELLIYTTQEVLQRELPTEYQDKRDLLATSIGEELSLDDIEAINLVVQNRSRNLKPVLITFYGNDTTSFQETTIGSLLLLGLDPSLVYVKEVTRDTPAKAEISLYY